MAEQILTYTVDHSPPVRTADERIQFSYWAIAQHGRNPPAEEVSVEIFVDNRPIETLTTQPDGRTVDKPYTSEPGVTAVTLEAQEAGYAGRRSPRKIVRLEVARSAKPASIEPFKTRDPQRADHLLIVLLVLDENENPVQGETVHIKDPQDSRFIYPLDTTTDRSGMIRFSVPIEEERDITAIIRGLEEEITTSEF